MTLASMAEKLILMFWRRYAILGHGGYMRLIRSWDREAVYANALVLALGRHAARY